MTADSALWLAVVGVIALVALIPRVAVMVIGWRVSQRGARRVGALLVSAGALGIGVPVLVELIGFTIGISSAQPWGAEYRDAGFAVSGILGLAGRLAVWFCLSLAAFHAVRAREVSDG